MTTFEEWLSYAQVSALLKYDSETGKLFWKERPVEMFKGGSIGDEAAARRWNKMYAGKEAFTYISSKGYRKGTIFGRQYNAHRVIWLICTGEEPDLIDHINGDPCDNRPGNLVSASLNSRNRGYSRDRIRGVHKQKNRWFAVINVAGVRYRKSFASIEDAAAWRRSMEDAHGFINRDGGVSA